MVVLKPDERGLLHGNVEAMRSGIELTRVGLGRIDPSVGRRKSALRMPSTVNSSSSRRNWTRRGAGTVLAARPGQSLPRPTRLETASRRDAVAEEPFLGAHHANDNAGGELIGCRTQERGSEASSTQ